MLYFFIKILIFLKFFTHSVDSSRPQTPKKPYPYIDEEVRFKNFKSNIQLDGSLTYKNKTTYHVCVVLAHASGGHTRNEELYGHMTFLVLADHLTRKNIVVLRFDERGIGKSEGNYSMATLTDFADDVLAGIDYLKSRDEFKNCKIGIIGHSKGGLTAMIAAKNSKNVNFIVLLGSPAIDLVDVFINQVKYIQKSLNSDEITIQKYVEFNKVSFEIIKKENNRTLLEEKLIKLINETIGENDGYIEIFMEAWFKDSLLFNPINTLKHIKIPVLALYGTLDMHVIPDENIKGLKQGMKLANNSNYKIIKIKKLNHLFQTAQSGSPDEFNKISETISPKVSSIISKWINNIFFSCA